MSDDRLYKWLNADMTTTYQNKKWPVAVGEWTASETPVVCKSGWHGCVEGNIIDHVPSNYGAVLWEVEVRGEVVRGDDKFSAQSMRLLWPVGTLTYERVALWACDVAEDVLPIFEAWAPNDDRPRRSIEATRAYVVARMSGDARAAGAAEAAWAARAAGAAGAAEAARAAWAAWAAWAAGAAEAAWAARAAGAAGAAEAARAAWAADAAEAAEVRAIYSNWLVVRIESDR